MPQKRKPKGKGRPLSLPFLDNNPRYKTSHPVQLPTPWKTPQLKLPLRPAKFVCTGNGKLVRARVGMKKVSMEEVEQEESA